MAGLLDLFAGSDDPETRRALMALSAGLLSANGSKGLGRGLLGFSESTRQSEDDKQRREVNQLNLTQKQMELERMRRLDTNEQGLAGLQSEFFQPAAAARPGTGDVNAALPPEFRIGALPAMAAQAPKFDVRGYTSAALQKGFMNPIDAIKLQQAMAKETPLNKIDPKDFKPASVAKFLQTGNYGDLERLDKLHFANTGGAMAALDPFSGRPVSSMPMTQSPESLASNALGWANNAATLRGQNMTDARAREANSAGKVPAGYRLAPDGNGLEFIPGGPADPNAAKRAAPTEFQGKSATYGTRALEADKIIQSLDGKYSPAAVNAKMALGNVWGVGGALEAGGNSILSSQGQKAEQAQRDFVNAVLRQESGAAISQGEFDNARKQYFPQPGDSAAVKAQKAANRQTAIKGFMANARPGGVTPNTGAVTASFDDDNDPLGLRK